MTPYALSQTSLPPPKPLLENELRQILEQLYELEYLRTTYTELKATFQRDQEQDIRDKELNAQALALKDERIALVNDKLVLAEERATMWEDLYKAHTKKPSIGCRVVEALTLWIYRCK